VEAVRGGRSRVSVLAKREGKGGAGRLWLAGEEGWGAEREAIL
jgi:hypothetical protein